MDNISIAENEPMAMELIIISNNICLINNPHIAKDFSYTNLDSLKNFLAR